MVAAKLWPVMGGNGWSQMVARFSNAQICAFIVNKQSSSHIPQILNIEGGV